MGWVPLPPDRCGDRVHDVQRPPGFLATLFDINFKSFLTMRFVKVIYVLAIVLIVGGGLSALILGIFFAVKAQSPVMALLIALGSLILVPMVTLLWLTMVRVLLESLAIFFHIGENTTELLYGNRALLRALVPPPVPAPHPPVPSSPVPSPPVPSPPVPNGEELGNGEAGPTGS